MFRNVVGLIDSDVNVFLGNSSEDIELQRNEVLYESFESVSDGDDGIFLDEGGVFSLEESL